MRKTAARAAFVGRDDELDVLTEAFGAAERGHGRLVLLTGPPGIGKTRLADELAGRVRERGGLVLWGRAWADSGAPPYWPWVQALRAWLVLVDDETASSRLGPVAGEVAQLLPEAIGLVPRVRVREREPAEATRFRLFDSVSTFLRGAASDRPIAVILDDVHAADPGSMLLLRFLAGRLDGARLLIVGTSRDLGGPDDPGSMLVAELSREAACTSLRLTGLASDAIASLLEAEIGAAPSRSLVSSLSRVTSGNPLFLGEAIRLLGAEGRLEDLDERSLVRRQLVPASIQAVIGDRLARLPAQTIDVLRPASAIGPEFEAGLLAAVVAGDGVGSTRADRSGLLEVLEPAVRTGLLVDLGTGGFRFAHDLVRQSLHEGLTAAERCDVHARIGRALEAEPASVEAHLAELAFHFHEAELARHYGLATPSVEPVIVLDYAARAARSATAALAFEDAARLYRLALGVLDDHPGTAGVPRLELLLALGDADARAGDLPAARRSFLAAAGIAREVGAGPELAQAALGYGGRFIWSRAGDDPQIVPLLEDALALLEASQADDRLRTRVMARLACAWRSDMTHRSDSERLSHRALELARSLGDASTLTYALAGRFWATYWPENPADRLAIADELLAVAARVGDLERTFDGHQARVAALLDLGRIDEARAQLAAAEAAARASRQPPQQLGIQAYEIVLALLAGRFADAGSQLARLGSDAGINPIRDDLSTSRIHEFLLRREQGRLAEVEVEIRDSVDAFPWYPYFRAALVCLLLDLGRTDEARARFVALSEGDFEAVYPDSEWFLGLSLASEACARLGDAQAAATLYAKLLPFAGRHAVGHAEGSLGAVDRYLGLLAGTLGRADEAERHFAQAVVLNERFGAPPWVAHTRADWAEAILEAGITDAAARANRLLEAAREVAHELGMTALLARLEAIARAHARALGLVEPAGTEAATATATDGSPLAGPRMAIFRPEGEYWTVRFDEVGCRLRDTKGMRYLARLLANPGRELHVLDLVGTTRASGRADALAGSETATGEATLGFGDAGEVLDAEARAAYRERLRDIEADLAEAEAWNDPERAGRLSAERAALIEQLAAAVGLGGRSRFAGSTSERARLSVAKAIRSSLRRIDASCAPLGRHLALAIRTGTFCSYAPDPGLGLTWDLGTGSDG